MDCSAFRTIDLEQWGQVLSEPLKGGRYPISATFELTNRCNFNCVHCYINQPANSATEKKQELTTEEIKKIIDQMVDAGVLFLTLTGGEPLLRPDFSEIYTYARLKGLLVIVFTNGSMITEEIADLFADLRPFYIDISIYGATPEVFDAVTRMPGSYNKCLKGIERILERGLPLKLKSELLTVNIKELPAMKALAEKLGLDFRYDGLLWPRIDGAGGFPLAVQLPIETLVDIDNADLDRRESIIKEIQRLRTLKTRDARVFSCGAGLRNFHLDSKGHMSICTMVRKPAYDLRKIPLLEAWEQLGDLRKLKRTKPSKCLSCTTNILCTQCPGWSQAIHGDFESVVEFVCKHGRLRTQNAYNIIKEQKNQMEVINHYEEEILQSTSRQ